MNFTFGIITCNETNQWMFQIVNSIKKLNIPQYEILIIGESGIPDDSIVKNIPFEESRPGWITRKKNLITQNALYDNIVYTHDYHTFNPTWYEGFLKFGDDFKVCCNVITNLDGNRYRDWLWWDWPGEPHSHNDPIYIPNLEHVLPYSETRCSRWMYINGSYWVAKKSVMKELPLDESLLQGQLEDVIWSHQVSVKYNFSINNYSGVTMLKYKDPYWKIMSSNTYNRVLVPFLKSRGL
jgi:hypothetical protein